MKICLRFCLLWLMMIGLPAWAASEQVEAEIDFPTPIEEYAKSENGATLGEILLQRAQTQPFNVVATIIFACAVVHTFFTARFRH
jgi:hypothetical protein